MAAKKKPDAPADPKKPKKPKAERDAAVHAKLHGDPETRGKQWRDGAVNGVRWL